MNKVVIFNVGGALSSYAEFSDKKVMVDLGKGAEFSPVTDFLLPLSNTKTFSKWDRRSPDEGKFVIDQLFLSHLDNDHIADFEKFRENFFPLYMTCPNDNDKQLSQFKVKREYLGEITDCKGQVLAEMKGRSPTEANDFDMSNSNPLVSTVNEMSLFYIRPDHCMKDDTLRMGYSNNISLVLFLNAGQKTLLFPGDIMTEGMQFLIDNCDEFKKKLHENGVSFLVAPHHGLQTAFSKCLFATMRGNKSRLNIISEKVRTHESSEHRTDVDSRYYSSDYSTGDNSLGQYAVKTSGGHLVIDLESNESDVVQYSDIKDVIREFI